MGKGLEVSHRSCYAGGQGKGKGKVKDDLTRLARRRDVASMI